MTPDDRQMPIRLSEIQPASGSVRPATVARTTQPDFPPAASPTAAPPTIQITIGRIDVRAIPPAPPPRPMRAAARPALGLDAYLKQRGRQEI
jgi:hypothetical protein